MIIQGSISTVSILDKCCISNLNRMKKDLTVQQNIEVDVKKCPRCFGLKFVRFSQNDTLKRELCDKF